MRQTFEFTNEELDELAENATALIAWLEEDSPTSELTERRIRIPSHLALVTTTIMASGLPLLFRSCIARGCLLGRWWWVLRLRLTTHFPFVPALVG